MLLELTVLWAVVKTRLLSHNFIFYTITTVMIIDIIVYIHDILHDVPSSILNKDVSRNALYIRAGTVFATLDRALMSSAIIGDPFLLDLYAILVSNYKSQMYCGCQYYSNATRLGNDKYLTDEMNSIFQFRFSPLTVAIFIKLMVNIGIMISLNLTLAYMQEQVSFFKFRLSPVP
ncbi:unnamed protein product [Cylicostephanus goldi]|uniref:Uncharacterized protein n=1 Tax=Cylicostephanus goldi TaxID=71465 RepID=A0A3P6QXF7_CYLGO|nr:unnamed protein product [Cylicostephanus goldi]